MHRKDNIFGKKILYLIEYMKRHRTPVNIRLLEEGHEGLTIVTGVNPDQEEPFFTIDFPIGFKERLKNPKGRRVYLEFLGPERIPYAFRSTLEGDDGENYRLRIPAVMERIQRRTHFRLSPPVGTHLTFERNGAFRKYSMIDLSAGGALICPFPGTPKGDRLSPGDHIHGITISCPKGLGGARIYIQEAIVQRVERDPATGRRTLALKFLESARREMIKLEDWLFACQREMLQKRSLMKWD
ncbi:MAG: hypothetical protein JRH13_09925 [Deltaproteobacteria bacterium]|nr:hypothetical protein [Deltaproteobacteria bacterium]MBW2015451.1 hypothetical protein [Deltaproteobacteria bacterium]MBW2129669.1 hypothetical protein [Deltaproteobacteria bacterium]MBW2304867.1 hypothetical protein [Deltaproteobacteria bacterium]